MSELQKHLADNSAAGQRFQSACVRALDAHTCIEHAAKRLNEEMDDVTAPHGVPVVELAAEDSVVTSIEAARAAHQKKG
jgi:hypothetical protein